MQTEKTVSFSGYRPEKLPNQGEESSFEVQAIKENLRHAVTQAIEMGYDTFLVGMANGFDTFAGEAVIELKKIYNHIKLVCVLPFAKQEDDEDKISKNYKKLVDNADEVVTLAENYTRGAYYVRNEYLIDNSSLLICFYDGRYGGTEYTIAYAQKKGKQIVNLAPKDIDIVRNFNNISDTVRDDLERTLQANCTLSMATSCFSIYAYESLKRRLKKINKMNFIFTSPTFVQEKTPKEIREFYIPRLARERSLYGTEFEVKLRNELNQKAIAKECAEWIRKRATFKSNTTSQQMPGFLTVENAENSYTYLPINGFTTADLGSEKNNASYNLVTRLSKQANQDYKKQFNALWTDNKKLQDVTEEVIENITQVYKENTPEYIYHLTLYHIFNEFLEDISEDNLPNEALGFKNSVIWNKLYNFQKDAALGIITKLEKYNGCILADSVGLGKTFTALSVIKYYESRNKDVLVLCPKKLADNWNTFKGNYVNNILHKDRLAYTVLYHTDLGRDKGISNGIDLSKINWANFGLVVIDESHNFRNGGEVRINEEGDDIRENRYSRLMSQVIKAGIHTKVLMLSATPVNNRFNDLKNQLALAYEGNAENIDDKLNTSRSINDIFRLAQRTFNIWSNLPLANRTANTLQKMLDFDFFEVLDSVTIARSRKQIENHYSMADIGTFPQRNKPISKRPALTNLDKAITYNDIFNNLMKLNLAIYTPLFYIHPSRLTKYKDKLSEKDLDFARGREQGIKKLTAINLMKRMESSVYSFSLTLARIKNLISETVQTLKDFEKNKEAQTIKLHDITEASEADYDYDDINSNLFSVGKDVKIDLTDMDTITWKRNLELDIELLEILSLMIADITPKHDSKLQELLQVIDTKQANPINKGNKKILIFTAFADTAHYLYENIAPHVQARHKIHTAMVTGSVDARTTIPKFRANLNELLTCFSPLSKEKALTMQNNHDEIDILIATDCISEGQNLQDCDYIINYDIHWNPVRIVQRFGRIDRIGSQNEYIQLVNFWPNISLDEYINLKSRVETRMKIVDMTATGDDNILSDEEKTDLEYRKKQLEKLQEEVVDLEDISGGISIMDLGLNEFRMDLIDYMRENPEIEKAPYGLHALTQGNEEGIIFILKNINKDVNIQDKNRLHPFYIVYISKDGSILCDHLSPKNVLDKMRLVCKGKAEIYKELCQAFNAQTKDGKDMSVISSLLSQTISSIIEVKEESEIDSFLGGEDMSFFANEIKGIDDFELISFVVIRGIF